MFRSTFFRAASLLLAFVLSGQGPEIARAELDPDALINSATTPRKFNVSKQDAMKGIAERTGLETKDSRLKEMLAGKLPAVPRDIPVVKHLRAEGGIPFATTAAANARDTKALKLWLADPKNRAKIKKPIVVARKMPSTSEVQLKRCRGSNTTSTATAFAGRPEKAKELQFDFLFIHKDDLGNLLNERHELFGSKVQLRVVGADLVGPAAAARGFNVECLPTRVRATRSTVFRHTGADALANFDSSPNGLGVVHELMADAAKQYE